MLENEQQKIVKNTCLGRWGRPGGSVERHVLCYQGNHLGRWETS
jgi:hypothetical protein